MPFPFNACEAPVHTLRPQFSTAQPPYPVALTALSTDSPKRLPVGTSPGYYKPQATSF